MAKKQEPSKPNEDTSAETNSPAKPLDGKDRTQSTTVLPPTVVQQQSGSQAAAEKQLTALQEAHKGAKKSSAKQRAVAQQTAVQDTFEEKNQALSPVPQAFQLSPTVKSKIKESKVTDPNFDSSQIIRLQDAPVFLMLELQTEIGFTPEKVLQIAQKLDPRIIIELGTGDILLDRKRLKEGFAAYLKSQQDKGLLKMSRNSRAGLRRNIQIREVMAILEDLFEEQQDLKERVTKRINDAFGNEHKHMRGDDVVAFVESYRINAERRRIREEEKELELQALEDFGF